MAIKGLSLAIQTINYRRILWQSVEKNVKCIQGFVDTLHQRHNGIEGRWLSSKTGKHLS